MLHSGSILLKPCVVCAGYGSYQYFIKIIPTIYTDGSAVETLSNQVTRTGSGTCLDSRMSD